MLPINRKCASLGVLFAAVMAAALMPIVSGAQEGPRGFAGPTCGWPSAGAPMLITEECVDPRYTTPFIDVDEWRDKPVRHRYIHGGFKGTDALFSFALPPAEQYQRRFFQRTHMSFVEELPSGDITFVAAQGGYLVRTNQGGKEAKDEAKAYFSPGFDGTAQGYRANAAAAKYSRVVAAQMYGAHRPYGYIFGASGGGMQSIASLENTIGVWDGAVPNVMTSGHAHIRVAAWVHTRRVLNDKFASVIDALEPGGADMFAGLNEEERQTLAETSRFGFPPRTWFHYLAKRQGLFPTMIDLIPTLDPTYVDDFWSKPGYLGTDPKSAIRKSRVQHETTVVEVTSKGLKLSSLPKGGGDLLLTFPFLVVLSGAEKGQNMIMTGLDAATNTVSGMPGGQSGAGFTFTLQNVKPGDRVRIDNSWGLASHSYYRHQVPERGSALDHPAFDVFRDRDGRPLYPQRRVLIAPTFLLGTVGALQTGRMHGKMIMIQNLYDGNSWWWDAEWYRKTVEKARGRQFADENHRLWFTDRAEHGGPGTDTAGLIDYSGITQQALRDVSAWAEKGVAPPANTQYEVAEGQVKLPASAAKRGGIQPVVELKANGGERAEVKVGQPVTFTAKIEAPPGTGKIVAAEWDFMGVGNYPTPEKLGDLKATVSLKTTFTFSKPGTYFSVLRATSQREGDAKTPYARVQNLARVRVVVAP